MGTIPSPNFKRLTTVAVEAPGDDQPAAVALSVYADCNTRRNAFFPDQPSAALLGRLAEMSPRVMWIAVEDAITNAAAAGRNEVLAEDIHDRRPSQRAKIGFV